MEELAHLTNAAKAGAFEEEGLFAYAEFTNSPKASKTQEDLRKIFDFGFRVFSLSSSNMNEVFYNPKEMTQSLLEATIDNVRPDRNSLDLLFQVMAKKYLLLKIITLLHVLKMKLMIKQLKRLQNYIQFMRVSKVHHLTATQLT